MIDSLKSIMITTRVGHVMFGRVNNCRVKFLCFLTSQWIKFIEIGYCLINFNSDAIFNVRRKKVDTVSSDSESSPAEFIIIAVVLQVGKTHENVFLTYFYAPFQFENKFTILNGGAKIINT